VQNGDGVGDTPGITGRNVRPLTDLRADAEEAGIETWIVNGLLDNFILKALHEEVTFTRIDRV